jgi:uncharacterized membrane protein
MPQHLIKDLPELTKAGLITEEQAINISHYYHEKSKHSPNRLVMVFGILGALLVGLGIILIIAHNWDDLSKPLKLFFALLPLVLGQGLCAYTLYRKSDNPVWREASSVFLLFAIGASITMVSQIYNIQGSLAGFLLVWTLLSIPLVYLLRSSMTSLLVICGITWYACSLSYFEYPTEVAWYYWLMIGALIPYFMLLIKKDSNFFHFHTWFLSLSIIITLGMFGSDGEYLFIAYVSLFCVYILLGGMKPFSDGSLASNGLLITGSLGLTGLLLVLTFDSIWVHIYKTELAMNTEVVVSLLVSAFALLILMYEVRKKRIAGVNPKAWVFLIFILIFMTSRLQPDTAQWLTNILVLSMAIATTWRGAQQDNMLILNYGLLIMTALVLCRFFDTDLSFIIRGILFMVVGASFFAANYWMVKRRKLSNT